MLSPTASQERIRDHAALGLLVVAPAGCGKTEALALRVAGLIARGQVRAPSRVLVTTFSNRARDNAWDRLHAHIPAQVMRDMVTVSNFHGLAARIIRAHANVIGLDPDLIPPSSDWVAEECRRRNLSYPVQRDVEARLREAKQQMIDDAGVLRALEEGGNQVAVDIERQRVIEGRLTYDDLLRLAELILANEHVAALYSKHFGAVVVDEFQDLTPQQLRVVKRIGYRKTTYAGDLAQGIYGFAGARPDEIYQALRAECSDEITFFESHRSSPTLLTMVNSLASLTGGQQLVAADPDSWPGGGLAAGARFDNVTEESGWILNFCRYVLTNAPGQRIGVLARTRARRRFVDELLESSGLPFHRWEDGVLDTTTARTVKAMLPLVSMSNFASADDQVEYLRQIAALDQVQDPDERTPLAQALDWCCDLLRDGVAPSDIRARIRIGDDSTLLTIPGVHLLTGHAGKGQQFDWIVVTGLEDGVLPDFRAARTIDGHAEEARILSVMLSRARHGAIVTYSRSVPIADGTPRLREPSPFLENLRSCGAIGPGGVRQWLEAAHWDEIAIR